MSDANDCNEHIIYYIFMMFMTLMTESPGVPSLFSRHLKVKGEYKFKF